MDAWKLINCCLLAALTTSACPTQAQEIQLDRSFLLGIPSELSSDSYDVQTLLDQFGSLDTKTENLVAENWLVVPRASLMPEIVESFRNSITSGECLACYGGGIIGIPLTPITPEMMTIPCPSCFGGGYVVDPFGSGLVDIPKQTTALDLQGTTSLSVVARDAVHSAISHLLHFRTEMLELDCAAPFIGDAILADAPPFGNASRLRIVAPSELFADDRPGYWFRFTMSIMDEGESIEFGGGQIGRRLFIVDDLRFSGRGVCLPFWTGTPLPSDVNEVFYDDAVRIEIESQIAGFFVRGLGVDSPDWADWFKHVQ